MRNESSASRNLDRFNRLVDVLDDARDDLHAAQRSASPTALRRARAHLKKANSAITEALALCEPANERRAGGHANVGPALTFTASGVIRPQQRLHKSLAVSSNGAKV